MSAQQVIWKYRMRGPEVGIEMPAGSRLLHVAMQHPAVMVWALVDPNAPVVIRRVLAVPTGGVVPTGLEYVGSVVDSLVWHVFDGGEA